jgi:hypothetical protein
MPETPERSNDGKEHIDYLQFEDRCNEFSASVHVFAPRWLALCPGPTPPDILAAWLNTVFQAAREAGA